jgi:hypothetical protein
MGNDWRRRRASPAAQSYLQRKVLRSACAELQVRGVRRALRAMRGGLVIGAGGALHGARIVCDAMRLMSGSQQTASPQPRRSKDATLSKSQVERMSLTASTKMLSTSTREKRT